MSVKKLTRPSAMTFRVTPARRASRMPPGAAAPGARVGRVMAAMMNPRAARRGPPCAARQGTACAARRGPIAPREARYPAGMDRIRIVDVIDAATFGLLPPCVDPAFDHRSCDYWEDRDSGSKAHRAGWLESKPAPGAAPGQAASAPRRAPTNPFAPTSDERPANPFAPATARRPGSNPFALEDDAEADPNPFAPSRPARPGVPAGGPRKLGLLGRGLAVFGSYAKVLLLEEDDGARPVAYAQFGPLSAYPRALRLRELYPQLPAVITCIATIEVAHGRGLALRLVAAVCEDLAGRGFFAVEAYPEANARLHATSAATPAFWVRAPGRRGAEEPDAPCCTWLVGAGSWVRR